MSDALSTQPQVPSTSAPDPETTANPGISTEIDAHKEVSTNSTNTDVNAPYGLNAGERKWRLLQPALEKRGYDLRARYQPGWVGSWVGKWWKRAKSCEDSIAVPDDIIVIDARRRSDGQQVLLKLWSDEEQDVKELPVLRFFSAAPRSTNPKNHCVPLLDTLDLTSDAPTDEAAQDEAAAALKRVLNIFSLVLVEPLLRDWRSPDFVMVAEGLQFILQCLEGLEFMHSNNVAHGDIHSGNILMDASRLFPDGFHGAFNLNLDHRHSESGLRRLSRLQAPVKYYLIDFGSSSLFPGFEERGMVRTTAAVIGLPEVVNSGDEDALYDPFKADIFAMGLTLLEYFRLRPGMWFLLPTLGTMIRHNPDERPTATQMRQRVQQLVSQLPKKQLRARLGWWRKRVRLSPWQYIQDWKEYIRVRRHSYKYGLPKEVTDFEALGQSAIV